MQTRENEVTVVVQQILDQVRRAVVGKDVTLMWVLAAILALLAVCGATVYLVDPCLYYRMPTRYQPVFFSERYQAAGLARNVEADTVLMGTSMASSRADWVREVARFSSSARNRLVITAPLW